MASVGNFGPISLRTGVERNIKVGGQCVEDLLVLRPGAGHWRGWRRVTEEERRRTGEQLGRDLGERHRAEPGDQAGDRPRAGGGGEGLEEIVLLVDDGEDGEGGEVVHQRSGGRGGAGRVDGWLFGGKLVGEADPAVSSSGAGRHERRLEVLPADRPRLGLTVLPGQELDLDLGVLVPSPPPARGGLHPRPGWSGGVVPVVGRVYVPEPAFPRLLLAPRDF